MICDLNLASMHGVNKMQLFLNGLVTTIRNLIPFRRRNVVGTAVLKSKYRLLCDRGESSASLSMSRRARIAVFPFTFALLANVASAQDPNVNSNDEQQEPIDTSNMEEVVVSGVRDKILNLVTIQSFHQVYEIGEHFYRTGQYTKAFPYLLASAKSGFKMSQARVSYIYQQGLGDIPRNGEAAIGWLGVAASHPTDPQILTRYKDMMRKIPKSLETEVSEIVAEYRYKYGPDATGNKCQVIRSAGSHMAVLKCNFEEEFEMRDGLFEELLAGLSGLDIDPTLPESTYAVPDANQSSVRGRVSSRRR